MGESTYQDPHLARLYDAAYADIEHLAPGPGGEPPQDAAFLLDLIGPPPKAVLELGCGTGRVLIPLAEAGHDVVGVDGSAFMLEQLARKAARLPRSVLDRLKWVEASWNDYELGAERFDAVVCPFSSFQRNITIEEQDRFLGLARRHLKPGGLLAIDAFFPDLARLASREVARHVIREFEVDGVPWLLHEAVVRYPARQSFEVCMEYTRADGSGHPVEHRFELTWFLPRELARMIAANGLALEGVLDGYEGGPVHDDSQHQVVVARRPQS